MTEEAVSYMLRCAYEAGVEAIIGASFGPFEVPVLGEDRVEAIYQAAATLLGLDVEEVKRVAGPSHDLYAAVLHRLYPNGGQGSEP